MYTDNELFDILNESGEKTGQTMERGEVHRTGALHGSVHIWVIRRRLEGSEVLLQKRASDKDSYPDCWDAASTGHINAGEDSLSAAVREVEEELGINAAPSELIPLFRCRVREDNVFNGKRFINNEITRVYLLRRDIRDEELRPERAEISELKWFGAERLGALLESGSGDFCVDREELREVLSCAESLLG